MFQQLPYQKVKYLEVKKETGNVILESVPSACPICKTSIEPVFIETYNVNNLIYAVFRRPVTEYEEYYLLKFFFNKNHPRPKKVYSFNNYAGQVSAELKNLEIIQDLSPNFSAIYNQEFIAEQYGLKEICGVGYRKAIEFLVKDYTIKFNLESENKITEPTYALGKCIKEFTPDPRIKDMVERAVWLGNDETHYTRKWTDKDLNDLKILIDLTLHWIQMELLSNEYKSQME
ncbi:DUF4145 domain-containing protein [Leeuwenhoekiella marinoflava]|uniref:DUF4145 domain-containing protein n=1 Tax=Leeuwenhoekiella marinoflava TaxID=988 RepID=UPI003002D6DF